MSESLFKAATAFCTKCGSILPLLQEFGSVKCYSCSADYNADNFNNIKFNYTVNFNTVTSATLENIVGNEPDGPVVERKCPKCGNDRMSYATLQLRSADEGQTVFYTCTKCK
ncbi:unnamed protein product [Plutella xylostella]|uniref:DNA-directed RNA polymerase subunit n=1 Tax=Plutella xylostella TaxID=51655 RepID=A0A8S4F6T1_PLUXY|nr:unnamed protein product [Plutella xylostella]